MLLRTPPFPGTDAKVAAIAVARIVPADTSDADADALAVAIREARVGGDFWAPAPPAGPFARVVRPRSARDAATLFDADASPRTLWLLPEARWGRRFARRSGATAAFGTVDPWPVLVAPVRLAAHGDDEWAALAALAGIAVEPLSPGRYAAVTARGVAADLLRETDWRDPFTGEATDAHEAVALLSSWRRQIDANRDIAAAAGFAFWKRREIERFLWAGRARPLPFVRSAGRAVRIAATRGGALAVWPSRVSPTLIAQAAEAKVGIVQVEDGFIRSVGLGSALFPPFSVTVDRHGIHYDPASASDLERLLETAAFPPALIARAEALIAFVRKARLGKYGGGDAGFVRPGGRRLVLVPGQVEDDLSVLKGGGDVAGNLDLLARARALEPDAEIWFRPHPDVDAGHRRGAVPDAAALAHADRIVRGGGMAALLEVVDAVHVLTSLAGFEALLRGCAVTTHGTPFYAGWGLTRDLAPVPSRRTRRLTVTQLAAGALILFPRYLDPVTGLPCPVETLAMRLASQIQPRATPLTALRRLQGMFTKRLA